MRIPANLIGAITLIMLGAGCTEQSPTPPASSPTAAPVTQIGKTDTVVVARGSEAGWTLMALGSPMASQVTIAGAADGPAMRALNAKVGRGGLRLHVGEGQAEGALVRTLQFAGTPLAELTTLSYRMFVVERGRDNATPLLTIAIDLNGDGSVDDLLVYRPTPVLGRWQSWDALHGSWQSNSSIGNPDARGMRTLAAYSAAAPNARLVSALTIGAWRVGGNRPLVAAVDAVAIGVRGRTTLFRFGSTVNKGATE